MNKFNNQQVEEVVKKLSQMRKRENFPMDENFKKALREQLIKRAIAADTVGARENFLKKLKKKWYVMALIPTTFLLVIMALQWNTTTLKIHGKQSSSIKKNEDHFIDFPHKEKILNLEFLKNQDTLLQKDENTQPESSSALPKDRSTIPYKNPAGSEIIQPRPVHVKPVQPGLETNPAFEEPAPPPTTTPPVQPTPPPTTTPPPVQPAPPPTTTPPVQPTPPPTTTPPPVQPAPPPTTTPPPVQPAPPPATTPPPVQPAPPPTTTPPPVLIIPGNIIIPMPPIWGTQETPTPLSSPMPPKTIR